MPLPKPSSHLNWTDGAPAKVTEPTVGKKLLGWIASERPPFQFMNWLFFRTDEWLKYFESVTDVGLAAQYNAIVKSSGGTHTSLAAALADIAVPAFGRIYVASNESISTPVQVTKNGVRIEFAPGVTFTKAAASQQAIQVSANDVRIEGGKFVGFNGGSDRGILIDAGSLRTRIQNCNFANCTTDIDDLEAATGVFTANITE